MNTTNKPTAYLIDDDKAIRDSMRVLFKSAGIPLVSFASAEEFLERIDEVSVGCLIVDVRLPKMSGSDLVREIQNRGLALPTIVFTDHAEVPDAVQAVKEGVLEYLAKPVADKDLTEKVRRALLLAEQWRQINDERSKIASRIGKLTPREREVMEMLVAGKKNKKIAEELGISRKTLDIHRAKVMSKMEANTIADLVRWSYLDNPKLLPTTAMSR